MRLADSNACRRPPARFFVPELQAWRGVAPLSLVFWVHGVCGSIVLMLLFVRALYLGQWLFLQALVLVSAAYTPLILVAIWRCAGNADPFWGTLARWLTCAWALNAGMVLFFIQCDLLVRYVAA